MSYEEKIWNKYWLVLAKKLKEIKEKKIRCARSEDNKFWGHIFI